MLRAFQAAKYDYFLDEFPTMNWKTFPDVWPKKTAEYVNYFDRIVILVVNIPNFLNSGLEKKYLVTGVLIDGSRILTTFNPFREYLRLPNITEKIVAVFPTAFRSYDEPNLIRRKNIICGRQIVYLPDDKNNQWHGTDRKHSPLHDLMVLRMEEEFPVSEYVTFGPYKYEERADTIYSCGGVYLTILAGRDQQLLKQGTLWIASLGYRTIKEMQEFDKIRVTAYQAEDNVLVDCEEWMPREWGFFICILNKDNFSGVGSGAMLYFNSKLYGVGSFAMFRKGKGILVFTDVRPYNELIMKTCGNYEFS